MRHAGSVEPVGLLAAKRGHRHRLRPPAGAIAARAAGPHLRRDPRQCGDTAGQGGARRHNRHALAYAGLRRLGLAEHASLIIHPEFMVPAAGQGIVGITVREDDTQMRELLAAIEDREARACAEAERAMLAVLDGSCNTPIGAHARITADGQLHLTGLLASTDGKFMIKQRLCGAMADAARIGQALGAELKAKAPASVFV